jgi:zona occludens toxin
MPINTYTGLMGSGKSFECVVSVILPALVAGRRVVTNVDGIDNDACRAYCVEKFGAELEKLGNVIHCKNDDLARSNFLPHGTDADTLCKPGDMVCIDEAWRFWGTDCKIQKEHAIFFREHRHYVDPQSKVSCDLVLMVQDISDLHRQLRVVVELSFRTTKIKSLGLNKIYRVEMWEGYKLTAKARVSVENKKYDPQIFPLYSSYVGGKGKELQVDKRQNILNNKKLWAMVAGMLALGCVSVYGVLHFFDASRYDKNGTSKVTKGGSSAQVVGAAPSAATANKTAAEGVSEAWRISGTLQFGSDAYVVLSNAAGRVRFEHPSAFQNKGMAMVGDVDGERVMVWSGAAPSGSLLGDKK